MKRPSSRFYRKIYEDYYDVKIPKGMHIHHADGNPYNNDPLNLIMVTPEEHAMLHGFLDDKGLMNWIAVQIHAAKKGAKIVGDMNAILLRGVCGRSKEQIVKDGRKGGIKSYELGVGLFAMTLEEKTQAGIKGAKNSNVVQKEKGVGFYNSETQRELGKRTFESVKLAIATEAAKSPAARALRSLSMSKKKWYYNPETYERCRTQIQPLGNWIPGRGKNNLLTNKLEQEIKI